MEGDPGSLNGGRPRASANINQEVDNGMPMGMGLEDPAPVAASFFGVDGMVVLSHLYRCDEQFIPYFVGEVLIRGGEEDRKVDEEGYFSNDKARDVDYDPVCYVVGFCRVLKIASIK